MSALVLRHLWPVLPPESICMISIKLADGFSEVTPHVAVRGGVVHVVTGGARVRRRVFDRAGALLSSAEQPLGYFPVTDGDTCLYHDGVTFREWSEAWCVPILLHIDLTHGSCGNSPLAVSPGGVVLHQDLGTGVYYGIDRVGEWRPTGIMRAREDGTPVMDDDSRRLWPYASGLCDEYDGVRVSEGESGIEGESNGVRYTLWYGRDTMRPRVAVEDDLVGITTYGRHGCWLWVGTKSELASLGTYNPVPVPPPVPPVPPVPPEVPVLDTIRSVRAKYPTPLGHDGAGMVCNEVCAIHLSDGWGMVYKPQGNNWRERSTDVIMNRVTGIAVDILGASEEAGIPTWNVLSPADTPSMDRWREPFTLGPVPGPVPPPVDPPDPGDDWESKFNALSRRVVALEDFMAGTFKTW